MLDLATTAATDEAAVIRLQAMKTGALFRFAAEAGAIVGRAPAGARAALARYGETLGLAFQLADDLIDATGSADAAGKATAKDAARGKATLVSLHGVEMARAPPRRPGRRGRRGAPSVRLARGEPDRSRPPRRGAPALTQTAHPPPEGTPRAFVIVSSRWINSSRQAPGSYGEVTEESCPIA